MFGKADDCTLGPTEGLPAIKQAGYGWVAFNWASPPWDDEMRIARANGLDVVLWQRCDVPYKIGELEFACKLARSPILLNLETPEVRSNEVMYQAALSLSRIGRGAVITDGWVDTAGSWRPLARWVKIVECFPEEDVRYADVHGCLVHAEGAIPNTRPAVASLGAYGTSWKGRLPVRADYAKTNPIVVYLGDTVEDWRKWPA
jgi:hypothetical protein